MRAQAGTRLSHFQQFSTLSSNGVIRCSYVSFGMRAILGTRRTVEFSALWSPVSARRQTGFEESNPWPSPSAPATDVFTTGAAYWPLTFPAGLNKRWLLPHEQPDLASQFLSSPQIDTSYGSPDGPDATEWPNAQASGWSTQAAPVVPIQFRLRPRLQPVPGVPPGGSRDVRPWWEPFPKAIQGFLDAYFRRGGSSGRRGTDNEDDDYCEKRYQGEVQRCYDRAWQMPANYLRGCLDRARERQISCTKNGGKPRLDEPLEWGDADEETWRNLNR